MIFLIEYARRTGHIISFRSFEDREREKAANVRLEMELTLQRERTDHEVVLLEAETQEALRRTHRRYFQSAREIVKSSSG